MDERRTHRSFVSYIERSREYYAAQGYARPYAWAHHEDAPFAVLPRALSRCRVALVTTAGRMPPEGGGRPARTLYAAPSEPAPARMFTGDLFWDQDATHTDDVNTFLPIDRLAEHAAAGRIGSVSPRFYGVPTDYSQRRTKLRSAPRVLEWCREDGVDAVLLSAL